MGPDTRRDLLRDAGDDVVAHLRRSLAGDGRVAVERVGDEVVVRPAIMAPGRHAWLRVHLVLEDECHYVVGRTEVREEHHPDLPLLEDLLIGVVAWAKDCVDGTLEEWCRVKKGTLVSVRARGRHGGGHRAADAHVPWGGTTDHVRYDAYPATPGADPT